MNKILASVLALAMLSTAAYFAMKPDDTSGTTGPRTVESPPEGASMVKVALPEELSGQAQMGKRAFDTVCAACHGENAAGRNGMGPPLVHKIYEPSHHAEAAFLLAVRNGVRAHHWRFGSMPPQDGLTGAEVKSITRYVRELQRANGIE
ncbi:c-type cytochrome [Antarcticimicrobium luteum]|uniref:C-type cytochrome n=1 Tax=Antarcticimicrobium luteum TaxID=2547397 RepID=A0A4R5VHB4_9RHOB|nr:cytochrome c [Antarcticimicrobium luteum]TDK52978.1 c-type cytochrome [Antarcticimicrobium luteum]